MATVRLRNEQRALERRRRREHRRSELLDAADRLVRERGAAVSMDEIAAEAGITKPILYRHFGDKDRLYAALAARYVDELMEELRRQRGAKGGRAHLAATIDAYLAYVDREPERYRFLLGAADEPTTSPIVAEFRRRLTAECAVATAENLRRAGVDPQAAEPYAHGVVGMVGSAGMWWLETRAMPREQLVEHLTRLLCGGFSSVRIGADPERRDTRPHPEAPASRRP